MRYEQLNHIERISFFTRLYKRLNKRLFNNELQPVLIDIRNINKDNTSCYGMYCKGDTLQEERILFSYELEDALEKCNTQREQAYIITLVLLHEMIHQYCAAKGIDDKNHSLQWQQAAEKHGLHSIYREGELQEEGLTLLAQITIANLQIRP